MAWVVDTCVLIDVARNDPTFGISSAQCLQQHWPEVLIACPVSIVELAPEFAGQIVQLRAFLVQAGIDDRAPWLDVDTTECAEGWNRYVEAKRLGLIQKRPVADVLIGGFAVRFQGLITRNPEHFSAIYPALRIVKP